MSKNKNAILVLMSTYNGEKYIVDQIESIENQVLDIPLNILIRDDGSKDNTIKIINKINRKYKNISVIKGKNLGCNASFFRLFSIANGYKYYAISDQDDIWLPDKLQRGINKLREEDDKTPLLYGSCSYIMDDSGEIKGTTQKMLRSMTLNNTIIQNFVPGHSEIINNALLDLLKEKIDYKKIYVYDYWVTNVAMINGKVLFDNEPSTKYRIHNSNTVGYGRNKIEWIKERLKRFNKGDGEIISSQINYFYVLNEEKIPDDYKKEIESFINDNNSFIKRLKFVLFTRLYRQKGLETILFKVAYLLGKYKIN